MQVLGHRGSKATRAVVARITAAHSSQPRPSLSDRIWIMPLLSVAVSALTQVLFLGGVPLFGYSIWQRRRYKRMFGETARRAGLQLGRPRYLAYSLLFARASVASLVIWPPPLEPLIRKGSMYRQFAGVGLGGQAIAMAF